MTCSAIRPHRYGHPNERELEAPSPYLHLECLLNPAFVCKVENKGGYEVVLLELE